jgi:hypothetical protein
MAGRAATGSGYHQVVVDLEEAERGPPDLTRGSTGGVEKDEASDCWVID